MARICGIFASEWRTDMNMRIALLALTILLFGCETPKSNSDAGTACYNSDNQIDSTYTSPFECKRGGGTWR
jgi:hypothetical protein